MADQQLITALQNEIDALNADIMASEKEIIDDLAPALESLLNEADDFNEKSGQIVDQLEDDNVQSWTDINDLDLLTHQEEQK